MPSVFTRIIDGELPGRIVYSDEYTAALLTIAPIRPGHTLVVPRVEIDRWTDLPDDVQARVWATAATVGRAIARAYEPQRVAVIVAGLEVPHAHVHLLPIENESQLDFALADPNPDPTDLDAAAERIRAALA
ncbi:HIT family protein [Frankia sp. R82]|uniref:HIT family protein n=1 Tax=Frankia sp. R82 TaxID=2950553 RepID=UPI002043C0AC|nr:HIT family protein [Frankia sp. R82]MCM3886888.1 HIT family protein [Frankia sp. R82]